MALVRWKNSGDLMPWSAFSDLQGELNRLMEDFTYDWNALGRNWRPPMDLVETQDAYVLEADVPGVSSDDLHIETLDNTITIRGKREYQFTAIDEYSRLRYADIYEDITPRNAVRFLRDALDFFQRHEIRVLQVQTDHGMEFTNAMFPHVTAEHPFERELRKEGIARKLTPIGKPHLQGKVERSHRIDDDEFHSWRIFRTSEARRRSFKAYINHYNHQRPHGSLNWKSPIQHLRSWQQGQSVNYD